MKNDENLNVSQRPPESYLWEALSDAQDESRKLSGKYVETVSIAADLRKELVCLKEIFEKKTKLEEKLKNRVDRLENELCLSQKAFDQARDFISKLEKSPDGGRLLEELNAEKDLSEKIKSEKELQKHIECLESELESRLRIIEKKEISENELKNEIKELVSRLDEGKTTSVKLEGARLEAVTCIEKLKNELSANNKLLSREVERNSKLSEKIRILDARITKLTMLSHEMSENLKSGKQFAKAAMRKISGLQAGTDELKRELSFSESKNNSLLKKLKEKQSEMESLEQEIQDRYVKNVPPLEEEEALYVPSALISHIKKPLDAVLSILKISAAKVPPNLQRSMRNALRATGIVADALKVWEEYSDPLQWETGACQVRGVLDPLLDVWDQHFRQRGVTLTRRIKARLPACIANDRKLRIAFYQIIRNAYEALPPGKSFTVSASADEEQNQVRVRFADTGPGLAPKIIKNLCVPFTSTKRGHMGLGLATAKKIAEKFNGEFTIANQLRGGVAAEFTFPVVEEETPALGDGDVGDGDVV